MGEGEGAGESEERLQAAMGLTLQQEEGKTLGRRVRGCSSFEKSLSGGTLSPFLKWTKKNLAFCDNMDDPG